MRLNIHKKNRGATNSGRWDVISRKEAFAKRDSTCRRQLHPNGFVYDFVACLSN